MITAIKLLISIFFVKCLNKGKLENFGHPYDLILDKTTIFNELIFSLDSAERTKLIEIAKKKKKSN